VTSAVVEILGADDFRKKELGVGRSGLGAEQTLQAELDVRGGELPAVVETDVLAEEKGVSLASVRNLPVFGQIGKDVQLGIQPGQAVENVLGDEDPVALGGIQAGREKLGESPEAEQSPGFGDILDPDGGAIGGRDERKNGGQSKCEARPRRRACPSWLKIHLDRSYL